MPQIGEGQQSKRQNREKIMKLLATWKLDAEEAGDQDQLAEILGIETAVLSSGKAAAEAAAQQAGMAGGMPPQDPMAAMGGMPGMGGGMPPMQPPTAPPLQGPGNPGGVGGVGQFPSFNADELRRLTTQ